MTDAAGPGGAALVVEEVTVAFGGLVALDAVSLAVSPGEILGVIGPNGAGKTTLFNAMCGFVTPRSGTITFGGRQVRRLHPHQLPGLGVARTLQGVGLWPGLTVLENVMAGAQVATRPRFLSALGGLPRSSRDEDGLSGRALQALRELEVDSVADRLPPTLPYAVQKRVSLARALVADPTYLLLDEPASGLSDEEMSSLGERLRHLAARMGIILVEHHMDLVMSVCDRLVVLDFGRVIARGAPDDVRGNPAVTAAYLGEELRDGSGAGSPDRQEQADAGR